MLAASAPLTELPRPGERIDRYRILAEVAHGGMAAVYAVRREGTLEVDKILAMKVLLPHLATDAHFVDMFLDEARIAAQIHHANVVQMFEVAAYRGRPFMVMEFLRGRSFAQILRDGWADGSVPLAVVLSIVADAAEGLHAAHEARDVDGRPLGVVHRDVSPQNIHVGYEGQVKVVDFGIAAARGRVTSTRTGEVKGKLEYMAPEQLHRRTPVDRRTDVWALGVILWQLLTRRRLFRGESDADTMFNVLNMDPDDVQSSSLEISDELASCVMACLSRDPGKRPATAADVARTLRLAVTATGGCEREDVAAFMQVYFSAARAVETERIAAALREAPPGPLHPPEDASGRARVLLTGTEAPPPAPKRKRRATASVLALLASGAIAAALVLGAAEEPGDAPRAAATAPAPPAEETIRLGIDDSSVRLVLVEGRLHEERPVLVSLAPEERSDIVLVGARGEQRLSVGIEDDGRRLAIAEQAPDPGPALEPPRSRPRSRLARPRRPSAMRTTPEAPAASTRVETGNTGLLPVDL